MVYWFIYYFFVWFNDSLSKSDHIASSRRAVVNNELERMRNPFFWNMALCPRRSYLYLMMNTILSTDRMVSAAKNATHELAQDLAANDNLLQLTLKALAHYTPLEMLHVLSLRTMAEQLVTPTSSSSVAPPMVSPPHCAWHANSPTAIPRVSSRRLWTLFKLPRCVGVRLPIKARHVPEKG